MVINMETLNFKKIFNINIKTLNYYSMGQICRFRFHNDNNMCYVFYYFKCSME